MEDLKRYPGLLLRGMTYSVRHIVPVDVRGRYEGREQIWRSLKTRDRSEAIQRYRLELLRFDQEVADKRRHANQEPPETTDIVEIERKVMLYYNQLVAWDEDRRLQGLSEEHFEELDHNTDEALGDFKQGMRRNDPATVEPEVQEFLAVHPEIKVTKGTPDYQRLVRAIYHANVRSLELVKARNQGLIVETPEVEPVAAKRLKLSEAFKIWRAEHRGPQKTADEFLAHLNRFISFHSDLHIHSITSEHVRTFKEAMLSYPARLSNAERKLEVSEVLRLYQDKDVQKLSPATINEKYLGPLKAILAHCVTNGLLTNNPAAGIRAKAEKVKKPARVPLTDNDIKTVLSFPVFTSNDRPVAGAGEAAKWLPLLAMFTGARLEELARLRKEDIRNEEGVVFLSIQDIVKTQSSFRKVPLHTQLITYGFLEFADSITTGPLFPLLNWEAEKVSSSWSKWWTRYRRLHGLDDNRKVFHSFRHTVKRKLRNANVEKSLRDAVMGHDADDVAEGYGLDEEGLGFSLVVLKAAIEKLTYDT